MIIDNMDTGNGGWRIAITVHMPLCGVYIAEGANDKGKKYTKIY